MQTHDIKNLFKTKRIQHMKYLLLELQNVECHIAEHIFGTCEENMHILA